MRVLHATAPGPVGGLESVVHALATGQRTRGLEVGVLVSRTPEDAEGPHAFVDGLRAAGVPVHDVVAPGWRLDREWRDTRRLLRDVAPDVVHTHGARSDLLAGGAALRLGIPVVSTQHGDALFTPRARAIRVLQRRLLRRFSGVVAVSRPLHDRLAGAGIPPSRLHVVPNAWMGGVDFVEAREAREALPVSGRTDRVPRLGWVGRLSHEKGADVFVDALELLDDRGRDLEVSILGDGPERAPLQRRTATFRSVDVAWHGAVPGAARLFRAFDLFVLSSRTEGTPIVLLEAMAAGVPILATAVGGVPDVTGPKAATLVRSEDPEALARAIRQALDDPDRLRAQVDAAARRLEHEFAAGPWLERHEALYTAITTASRSSPSDI